MLSFSISYPDLIKISYLWIPLKEGGTEVDFTDNSNVKKKEWVHHYQPMFGPLQVFITSHIEC